MGIKVCREKSEELRSWKPKDLRTADMGHHNIMFKQVRQRVLPPPRPGDWQSGVWRILPFSRFAGCGGPARAFVGEEPRTTTRRHSPESLSGPIRTRLIITRSESYRLRNCSYAGARIVDLSVALFTGIEFQRSCRWSLLLRTQLLKRENRSRSWHKHC